MGMFVRRVEASFNVLIVACLNILITPVVPLGHLMKNYASLFDDCVPTVFVGLRSNCCSLIGGVGVVIALLSPSDVEGRSVPSVGLCVFIAT